MRDLSHDGLFAMTERTGVFAHHAKTAVLHQRRRPHTYRVKGGPIKVCLYPIHRGRKGSKPLLSVSYLMSGRSLNDDRQGNSISKAEFELLGRIFIILNKVPAALLTGDFYWRKESSAVSSSSSNALGSRVGIVNAQPRSRRVSNS